MAYLATFKRTEKKYLMTKEKFQLLNEKINGRLQMDKYGEHTICNVYYDTDDYRLICESIEKPKYKEKLRVRCYGKADADSDVFLELKKKYKGVVYKRRVALTAKQAMEFTQNRVYPFESQVLREIEFFIDFYKCTPKVFIAYDRIALIYPEDKNFRVTFDKNIRSRMDDLDLTMGDSGNHLLKDKSHNEDPQHLGKAQHHHSGGKDHRTENEDHPPWGQSRSFLRQSRHHRL